LDTPKLHDEFKADANAQVYVLEKMGVRKNCCFLESVKKKEYSS